MSTTVFIKFLLCTGLIANAFSRAPTVYKVLDVDGEELPKVERSFLKDTRTWNRTLANCKKGSGVYRHCSLSESMGYFSFYVVVSAGRNRPQYVVCHCDETPNKAFGQLLASMIRRNSKSWPVVNEKKQYLVRMVYGGFSEEEAELIFDPLEIQSSSSEQFESSIQVTSSQ